MKLGSILLLSVALNAGAAETAPNAALPSDHAQRMTRGLDIFQRQVRSLLTEHCVKCHGGEKVKGEFDLTTRDALLRGGAGGPTVKLYDARSSRLYQFITHTKDPPMPSKAEKLPDDAISQIAAWIDNGAPYDQPLAASKETAKKDRSTITENDRQWWAFQPLKRVGPPKMKANESVRTPIDSFILTRLEEKKLKPNPPADRRTLIRRASFDLLGLPPTPEEMDAFTRDKSPDAWPKLITKLFDSPRYGERWGRHWLDLARYADSDGYEKDRPRPFAFRYRDWVIAALNADMPYDQFVRWQLAGDEFEPDNPLALMATGFLGAGVFPTQITANEVERTRYDAMDDMLATTGTAMLGLTIGCARCHDHKFDPIPTRDYYRMLSIFTTTVRSDIDLDLQPDVYRRAKETFDLEQAPLLATLKTYEEHDLPVKFDAWLAQGAPLPAPVTWELLEATELRSKAGATFKKLDDGSYLAEGKNGDSDVYTFTADIRSRGFRALRLEALSHPSMAKAGPGRADNGNIGLSRIRIFTSSLSGGETNEVKLVRARATFEQNSNTLSVASALDDNPKTGWALDPKFGTNHAAIFEFEKPVGFEGGTRLEVRLEFALNTKHNIGRPRLAVTTTEAPGFDGDALPPSLAAILAKLQKSGATQASLPPADRLALLNWWKTSEPGWQSLQNKVEAHTRQAPKPKLTKVLVCAEGYPALRMNTQGADFFNETYFLNRGSTDLKKEVATAGVLQVLMRDPALEKRWQWQPPAGAKFSGRRRALANWMTDTEQGAGQLLARVIVNRLWQHHFGQGLVATPNDFGAQGAQPTHPELLDWLAAELIRGGWRLKPIHQLIMTSAVYQQEASADAARLKLDPANALLSRRVPQRLEAEAVRDSLLFVSGVLDTNMFGPGTLDEASRRRSIYFTVKRSRLVPAMQAFDAPEPLVSQGTRPTTTVAPQALLLMNSPHVRSWAAAFAKRFAPTPEGPLVEKVNRAYSLALNRSPTRRERADAVAFIEQQRTRYRAEEKTDAREQALTDFAQVMFGLNEFIYAE
jgi:mono/diheme cytochrome c family protein